MAPDDRRAAIIEAALPLIMEHGLGVTTRQIAEAAGVAEGTLFNVFPDKNSLIGAALLTAFDPERPKESLTEHIDRSGDLRQRLTSAVDIMARGIKVVTPLLAVVRSMRNDSAEEIFRQLGEGRKSIQREVAAIIEPDRARLGRSPEVVARLLMSLVFAASHDEWSTGEHLSSEEIVTVLLDGVLVRPATTNYQTGEAA
jgi:AcrR family transcriptional regulator